MALKITAVGVGSVLGLPRPLLLHMRDFGAVQDIPLIMFVIEGGDSPIIVDTGADLERAGSVHGMDVRQAAHERPDDAVRALGVDPGDVQMVVNTHLHWDHSSNNHLFPNAKVVVQQRELDYAPHPVRWHGVTYEAGVGVEPAWMRARQQVDPVAGDVEVAPGVSVVALPGHTPGSQGVVVVGADRRYLIAGDCVYTYENWRGDARANHIPAGHYTNLIEYEASFDKIEGLDCEVVPSHDFEVLERSVFT